MKLTVNDHPAITSDMAKEIFPDIIKDFKLTAP